METGQSFTIRAFSDGTYRTVLVKGPPLSWSKRSALVENMQYWEVNPDSGPSAPIRERVCK